ncbi:hypothetical protein [Paraburkholderia sp.]|uniref:hypothetical protein n=1 Tax=Paraburkholderia sp. TaxID=1926495 RepID=UPI00262EF07E|nr:hypothetical protein [Paraburkholderia sp.]
MTTCLLTTALIENAPACVAAGAALPNGEWATINQFRDAGANGLVELGVDVDGSHPRLVDFDLSHPSAAMPRCIGTDGIGFEGIRWPTGKARVSTAQAVGQTGFDVRERALRLYD